MNKRTVSAIFNPHSGNQNLNLIETWLKQELNQDEFVLKIDYTEYKGHAVQIAAQAVKEKVDIIVVAGGDGTINEVASQMIGSDTALAIIPSGSGNGLARHLNIPLNLKKAIKLIKVGKIQKIDVGKVNKTYFFSTVGIGYDAKVAFDYDLRVKRGFWGYFKDILRNFFTWKSQKYVIKSATSEIVGSFFLVNVANASQWGYNVQIAPHASLKDGLVNISCMRKPPFYALLWVLSRMLNHHIDRVKYMQTLSAAQVEIEELDAAEMIAHID